MRCVWLPIHSGRHEAVGEAISGASLFRSDHQLESALSATPLPARALLGCGCANRRHVYGRINHVEDPSFRRAHDDLLQSLKYLRVGFRWA